MLCSVARTDRAACGDRNCLGIGLQLPLAIAVNVVVGLVME
jgi:hypothetical protein